MNTGEEISLKKNDEKLVDNFGWDHEIKINTVSDEHIRRMCEGRTAHK